MSVGRALVSVKIVTEEPCFLALDTLTDKFLESVNPRAFAHKTRMVQKLVYRTAKKIKKIGTLTIEASTVEASAIKSRNGRHSPAHRRLSIAAPSGTPIRGASEGAETDLPAGTVEKKNIYSKNSIGSETKDILQ